MFTNEEFNSIILVCECYLDNTDMLIDEKI
jgi:hypothetical protein